MENSIPEGKSRLGWFDALRGLAMVLVVFGHVMDVSIGTGGYNTVLNSVFITFKVPLFFLISGFFAYRAYECWTPALVGDIMKRRVQALIIGPRIFAVLALFCAYGDFSACLHGRFLFGNWFTTALFQMFLIFFVLSLLSKLFKSERILEVGLILASIAGVVILARCHGVNTVSLVADDSSLWGALYAGNLCKNFQFFALGIFCRKYRELFENLLSKNWFKATITIGFVLCLILYYHDGFRNFNTLLYGFVHDIAIRYFALLVVVALFFTQREFFETQKSASSVLRFVGRRTLDIYLLHDFFLPNLEFLKDSWLVSNHNLIFLLATVLIVTALIIAVCLLVSEILRMSNSLASWLFGVKSRS